MGEDQPVMATDGAAAMMDQTPTTFAMTAPRLHELGWRPIPLRPDTKIPCMRGWNERNATPWLEDELAWWIHNRPAAACGLAVPSSLAAIDLDITDPNIMGPVLRRADQLLGPSPLIRIGSAPKRVIIYRSDGTARSSKPHPIEIFSGTGQVALFGWHAKAGSPYQWPEASPLDLPADSPDIPLITAARGQAFLSSIAPLLDPLRRAKGVPRGGGGWNGQGAMERAQALNDRGVLPVNIAALLLRDVAAGERHNTVWAVASTAFRCGASRQQIARWIYRYAPPGVLDPEDVTNTLDHLEPKNNGGTILER